MATTITGQDTGNWLWNQTDPNTVYRTYDPKTGAFNADFGGGVGWGSTPRTNGDFGIQGELLKYLQAMGYTGPQDSGQSVWDAINTPDPLTGEYKDAAPGFEASKGRNPELEAFLQAQGLTLQEGVQHTPGASQKTWIQRLVGADGNPVAVDAYNDRYNAGDRFANLVQAGLLVAGVAGAGSAAGAWDLGGAAAGGGGTAAGGGGGAALGGGASGSGAGAGAASGVGAGSGAGAGAGVGAGAGGITAFEPIVVTGAKAAGGITGAQLAAGASALGGAASVAGGGSGATGGTQGAGNGAATEGSYWDLLNSGEMGTIGGGGSAGSAGWLDALKAGGGGLLDAVGGAKNLAPVIGAIAGASEGGKPNTASTSSKLDPVMQQYLYGTGFGDQNSFLGAAQNWFNQNKSGTNADMTAGMSQLRNLYSSPEYTQGYQQMRGIGQGLLSQPIAGNPFTQGQQAGGLLGPQQGPNDGLMYAGGTPGFYAPGGQGVNGLISDGMKQIPRKYGAGNG